MAEAKELHNRLGILLARSSVDPKVVQATKTIMNRAWSWYKLAADEVKETGQFAFEGTDRYDNYVSEFHRSSSKNAAKLSTAAETTEAAAV
ncbi:MAG: hypothetical protein JXX29_03935 [Deltaproteobacteria bacterium]|nr:hypothetical protein [Deltaproteobacteria bacterium]MBN2670794.1 hypothetical protein [Deltaproteobacteria bacterium]